MGLFGVKTIWSAAGGSLCSCCMRIREEFVHFGLGAASFDAGPGLCTYCWRRGHHRTGSCVDKQEFVCGRHPNETVKLNGRKRLWAELLEAALEDGVEPKAEPSELPQDWLERRFPPPTGILERLFGGEDLIKKSRRLPHPLHWGMQLETDAVERRLARLEQRVQAREAQV